MKKWYKECPFCANEIKEWAKKCQYCHEFLDKKEENENYKRQNDNYTWGNDVFENRFRYMMEEKDNETEFHALLRGFDYIWWIIILRCIIIVFKWYSIAPWWRRFIMWIYLIVRIYTVWKSTCNNVKVAKNTNITFRAIIKAREMIKANKDKDEILDTLNIAKLFNSFHK